MAPPCPRTSTRRARPVSHLLFLLSFFFFFFCPSFSPPDAFASPPSSSSPSSASSSSSSTGSQLIGWRFHHGQSGRQITAAIAPPVARLWNVYRKSCEAREASQQRGDDARDGCGYIKRQDSHALARRARSYAACLLDVSDDEPDDPERGDHDLEHALTPELALEVLTTRARQVSVRSRAPPRALPARPPASPSLGPSAPWLRAAGASSDLCQPKTNVAPRRPAQPRHVSAI